MFCCTIHRQKVVFRCDSVGNALPDRGASRTFSRTLRMNKHLPAMRPLLRVDPGKDDDDDGGSDADGEDDGRLDGGDDADGTVADHRMLDGVVWIVVVVAVDRVEVAVFGLALGSGDHFRWRTIAGGDGGTPDYGTALVLRVQRPRDDMRRQRQLQLLLRYGQRDQRLVGVLGG